MRRISVIKQDNQCLIIIIILLQLLPFFQSTSALRVLRSANVILSEDTRHSGKLLQYYDIKTPLVSFEFLFVIFILI